MKATLERLALLFLSISAMLTYGVP